MDNQDLMKSHQDVIVDVVKAESNAQNAAITAVASEVNRTQGMIKEASLEALVWEKRQRLLKSLKYDSMGERFDQIKPAAEGTYRWMIQTVPSAPDSNQGEPDGEDLPPACPHRTTDKKEVSWSCFPCWLESPKDKIYWIQGKPGSGKSTLMKFLATKSALWYSPRLPSGDSQDPLVLSHFLWAAGSTLPKSLRGILLNLLYRLLSNDQHALDHVIDTFPVLKFKDANGDWTLEELERTIVSSLNAVGTRPVFIFLDGLDEFGSFNSNAADDPCSLLDVATRLSTLSNVKTCVSSRPEPVFRNRLGALCSLRLQDLTRGDMKTYTTARLLSDDIVGLENQEEYQSLVDRLCDMSNGVFLWTALTV